MPEPQETMDRDGMNVGVMLKSPGWAVLEREFEEYSNHVTSKMLTGVGFVEYNALVAGHAAVKGFLTKIRAIAGKLQTEIRSREVRSKYPDSQFRGGR